MSDRAVEVHPLAAVDQTDHVEHDGQHDGETDVDDPQPHCRVPQSRRQLFRIRSGRLLLEERLAAGSRLV